MEIRKLVDEYKNTKDKRDRKSVHQ